MVRLTSKASERREDTQNQETSLTDLHQILGSCMISLTGDCPLVTDVSPGVGKLWLESHMHPGNPLFHPSSFLSGRLCSHEMFLLTMDACAVMLPLLTVKTVLY